MAEEDGDDHVRLPLGLIALTWLRLYLLFGPGMR
jgi:hypothetical protein